jgi:hypothetical protein
MSPGGPLSPRRTSQALARGLPGAGGVSIRNLRRRSSLASRFFNDSDRDTGCATTTTSSAVTMEGTPSLSRGMSSCSVGVSADTHERTSTWAPSPLPSAAGGERAGGAAASLPIGVLPDAQGIGSVAGSSSANHCQWHPGQLEAPLVVQPETPAATAVPVLGTMVVSSRRVDNDASRRHDRQLEAIHPLGSSAAPRAVSEPESAASGRSARVLTMRKPT